MINPKIGIGIVTVGFLAFLIALIGFPFTISTEAPMNTGVYALSPQADECTETADVYEMEDSATVNGLTGQTTFCFRAIDDTGQNVPDNYYNSTVDVLGAGNSPLYQVQIG